MFGRALLIGAAFAALGVSMPLAANAQTPGWMFEGGAAGREANAPPERDQPRANTVWRLTRDSGWAYASEATRDLTLIVFCHRNTYVLGLGVVENGKVKGGREIGEPGLIADMFNGVERATVVGRDGHNLDMGSVALRMIETQGTVHMRGLLDDDQLTMMMRATRFLVRIGSAEYVISGNGSTDRILNVRCT